MDAFAKNVNPLWTSTRANFLDCIGSASLGLSHETASAREKLENEVVVALIDDGVSLLDDNLAGRVLEGKTFDYSESGVGQSYNSAQGHGTEMARCILRVCPMAKIYPSEPFRNKSCPRYTKANLNAPVRLKIHMTHERKIQIDLESAALVSPPRFFSLLIAQSCLSKPSSLTRNVLFDRQYVLLWKRMPA